VDGPRGVGYTVARAIERREDELGSSIIETGQMRPSHAPGAHARPVPTSAPGSLRRILATLLAICAVGAMPAAANAYADPIPWKPDYKAAKAYAEARSGQIIAFSLRTEKHRWEWRQTETAQCMSVAKVMIMTAYLSKKSVRNRSLTSDEKDNLHAMITHSSDSAANNLFASVGYEGLRKLANRVGMKRFSTDGKHWGHSKIDATDQSLFLLHLDDRYLPARHRDYALHLMESITASQSWGGAEVKPAGWKYYFKHGWGLGTGMFDHEVALLRRGNDRIGLAIITYKDPSHDYGKDTIKGLAKRLFKGLGKAQVIE
jgi:hypothetical protein